ncbi:MAG: B12-binding domain-containing radical SAM protein [Terriglobales bacterium]
MRVHLINPSHLSFGVAVITPRWLFVLASATPAVYGDPVIADETLAPLDLTSVAPGDVAGIGIHTGNALRGYELGRALRARGAWVVFGGIHATLFPEEARAEGGAHAVVRGDGDVIWASAVADCAAGAPRPQYEGGRLGPEEFLPARWDLLPSGRYMWGSVQTVRGCPKHCSFCSVWRTDGQQPRQRSTEMVVGEIVELRRRGYRFIALADDNFYPVSLRDLELARRQGNTARVAELEATRRERFDLLDRLARLPSDLVLFTQITMESADDPDFLAAMSKAHIRGMLIGVEAVTPEGLKDVYKDFNSTGEDLVRRLRAYRQHNLHVLGSFIFGLPSDRPATFDATLELALRAEVTFAQFVMLTPFPGTVDFQKWEQGAAREEPAIGGIPVARHWLIPQALRPKVYVPHPVMSANEIRERTQRVWDRFYGMSEIWRRSRCVPGWRGRLAFLFISKLYRQMYANTGISTDSARVNKAARWAALLLRPCRRLFAAAPMPGLTVPAGREDLVAIAPAFSARAYRTGQ